MNTANGGPPSPRTLAERQLEKAQKVYTQGLIANAQRQDLIVELHDGGMTQVELAARLTRASLAAGGEPVGLDAVQKTISRVKRQRARGVR